MGMTFKKTDDNTQQAMTELDAAIWRALEKIGIQAEKYAKALCPVGTPESTGIPGYVGGTLRNSIAHLVDVGSKTVYIGTNVKYAPYVEMGTYKMTKKPYLKPAVEEHMQEYKNIVENELKV